MIRALLLVAAVTLVAGVLRAEEIRRVFTSGVNKPGEYHLPVKDCTLSTLLEQAGGVIPSYTEDAFILLNKGASKDFFRIKLSNLYGHDLDYELPNDAAVEISICNYWGGMSAKEYRALEKARAGYLARKQEGKIKTMPLEALKVKQPSSDLPSSLQGSPQLPFAVPTP